MNYRLLLVLSKQFVSNIRTMSVFTKKINPVTGKGEWVFHDENYDFHQEIARSAFADMLHDTERNQKYFQGIDLAIRKMHSRGKKANVLDIGTGTGLLAMMAASCGADSVIACEAFLPMAECAESVIIENNFSEKIKVIRKRSTDVTVGNDGDMKERANILVTEVFDTELIGEGALATFMHAHTCLLEEESIVVPSLATVYAQVVESDLANRWNKLQDWSTKYVSLRIPEAHKNCTGAAAVHDIQLGQFPQSQFHTLIEPTPVLRFDWSGQTPLKKAESIPIHVRAARSGKAQIVFMWWELLMDDEGTVKLSCTPAWVYPDGAKKPWRDHWMQALYYLPKEITVEKDQHLVLHANHDEYSLWFQLTGCSEKSSEEDNSLHPICNCGLHIMASRTRIGCMNDTTRQSKFISALKSAPVADEICICLSDGSLLSPVAAALGAKHIYCIETYELARQFLRDFLLSNKLENKVTIVSSPEELLTVDGLTEKVTVVFGEPAFFSSILPWHNIYFWYLKNELSPLLAPNVNIIPVKATLWGIAMEFDHLWKIRSPLHSVEGFSMIKFDELIEASSKISDSQIEAHPLWEYPGRALSKPFRILKFSFEEENPDIEIQISEKIDCGWCGTCHGIALWVDWHLDSSKENIISTGPKNNAYPGQQMIWDMHTRQGIYFMPVHQKIDKTDVILYSVYFCTRSGEMSFDFQIMDKK